MMDLKYCRNDNALYLKEVTYNYERVREYLKENLSSFTFVSNVSDIEFLISCSEKEFFSLDHLLGLVFDNDERLLRNKLLDILNLFKSMFSTLFSIECIEAKESDNENYCLLCLIDNSFKEVVSLRIDNCVGYIRFNDVKELIYNLLEKESLSFLSYYYQIGLSLIQDNQPIVNSLKKEVESKLSKFKIIHYNDNYLKTREKVHQNEVPLIVEIGPSNAKKREVTFVTKYETRQVSLDNFESEISSLIKVVDHLCHKESIKKVIGAQKKQDDIEKLKEGERFCLCSNLECKREVEKKLENKKIYQSFLNVSSNKKCIICSNPSSKVFFLS